MQSEIFLDLPRIILYCYDYKVDTIIMLYNYSN